MGNSTISWEGFQFKSFKQKMLAKLPTYLIEILYALKKKLTTHSYFKQNKIISYAFNRQFRFSEAYDKQQHPLAWTTIADHIHFTPDAGNHFAAIEAMFGVEHRDPTADRQVIEFCHSISNNIFCNDTHDRLLIREGMATRLPQKLLWRKTYGAQVADWYLKFNDELPLFKKMLDALHSSRYSKYFDIIYLNDLLESWELPNSAREAHLPLSL